MAFLGNSTVNRMNFHYGIHALAQGAGGIFVLVFMLRAGLSVPETLLALAAIVAGRFSLRPIVLPFAKRFGLKPLVIFGCIVHGLQYLVLGWVDGVGPILVLYVAVSSVGDVFYWSCYHAYFAALGDNEHRGKQIGAREAVAAVVGIVAPLIGAWLIVFAGAKFSFALVGVIQMLSALPLLGAPNVAVKAQASGVLRSARLAVTLFVLDGWFAGCFLLIWQVALFISLGESFSAYGGAMALAALVGAVAGLMLGHQIDGGRGQRAVLIAWIVAVAVTIMRATSLDWAEFAIFANALGALVSCLLVPAQMTPVYNLAQAAPCTLRFHIAAEGGWDVGCFAASVVGAALSAAGFSLAVVILLAVPAVSAIAFLLRGYYGANPVAIETSLAPEPPGQLP